MYRCWLTVPSTTTSSDLPDAWKAPHTMGRGPTFPSVSWMQQSTSLLTLAWFSTMRKPVSPHDSDKGTVFSWCGHPQLMPMWPLDSSSSLPSTTTDFGNSICDPSVFLDIALWDSLQQDNWTMSSNISGGTLAGIISTLFFNCNLCTATAHSCHLKCGFNVTFHSWLITVNVYM